MIQAPNPYVLPRMYPQMAQQAQQASYNAVKIDVHNPSLTAPSMYEQQAPQYPQAGYAQPTMPYYNYPQAQLYDYPVAQQQPTYFPATCPQCVTPIAQEPMAPVQPVTPITPVATVAPQIQQLDVAPAVVVPEPVVVQEPVKQAEVAQVEVAEAPVAPVTTEAPAEVEAPVAPAATEAPAPVEIEEAVKIAPQVDLNAFVAKLTDADFDVQASAMEEVANMVKDEPQKATELLDEKVMNSLTNIINNDSSKLEGPSAEQIAARQKLMTGKNMSDEETNLATTITPMEKSARNKSYAMFTFAIMDKLFAEEVNKLTSTTVPLTELPGVETIAEQLKSNSNPMVRASAIESLSYLQQPTYNKDLATLFEVAKNDTDKNVQEAANVALDKIAAATTKEAPKA